MNRFFKPSIGFTLFLLAMLSVSAAPSAADKVTVGVSPTASTGGVYLAFELGYFKEENLDVELQVFSASGAPMIPLLAKGDLDIGGGAIVASLYDSTAKDSRVVIVADKGAAREDGDYHKLMIRADLIESGRYKSLKDLKGMKFGLPSLGGVSIEAGAARFLKAGGLTTNDVEFVKVTYGDVEKVFQAKGIDAYVQLEPYVYAISKSGVAKAVQGVATVHPNQQAAAIFYSPKLVSTRFDVGVRFMKAYIKGCRAYRKAFLGPHDSPEFKEAVKILMKWTTVKDPVAYDKMIPTGLDPNGRLNLTAMKEDADYFISRKYISSQPNWDEVVNLKFVDSALKQLDGNATPKKKQKK